MARVDTEEGRVADDPANVEPEELSKPLLEALWAVEQGLAETGRALELAVHRAKEAEEVIRLLKHQVRWLRAHQEQGTEGRR